MYPWLLFAKVKNANNLVRTFKEFETKVIKKQAKFEF